MWSIAAVTSFIKAQILHTHTYILNVSFLFLMSFYYQRLSFISTLPQFCPFNFEHTSDFLSMKWQWTYGPTLLPWNNHFHTSEACLKPL